MYLPWIIVQYQDFYANEDRIGRLLDTVTCLICVAITRWSQLRCSATSGVVGVR